MAVGEQFDRQPGPVGKALTKLGGERSQPGLIRDWALRRHEQRGTARHAVVEIGGQQLVVPLGGARARRADQLAQPPIAVAVACEQHQPWGADGGPGCAGRVKGTASVGGVETVVQRKLGTDQEREMVCARLQMGPHHARERAFVGEGERRIAEFAGAIDQFLGV